MFDDSALCAALMKHDRQPSSSAARLFVVRPAERTLLEVKVLCTPGKGKCYNTERFESR